MGAAVFEAIREVDGEAQFGRGRLQLGVPWLQIRQGLFVRRGDQVGLQRVQCSHSRDQSFLCLRGLAEGGDDGLRPRRTTGEVPERIWNRPARRLDAHYELRPRGWAPQLLAVRFEYRETGEGDLAIFEIDAWRAFLRTPKPHGRLDYLRGSRA